MIKNILRKTLAMGVLAYVSTSVSAETFTVEKLNNLNKIRDVQVSPSGEQMIYGLKIPGGSNHLYLLDLKTKGAKAQQLTSHQSSSYSVQWNATGDGVYFLSGRSGSAQVWRLSLKGGEAMQVTDLPLDVEGFKVSPDDKKIAVALTVLPSCDTLKCSKKAMADKQAQKAKGKVFDKLMIRHWSSWESEFKSHVFVGKINENGVVTTPVKDLMPGWDTNVPAKPFSGMEEVAFTADSQHVVFSAKAPGRDHAWTTNFDLFKVSVDGGQMENMTAANPAMDIHPVFSKDGRFMAYMATKKPGFESDRMALMLKDLKTGALKEIAPLWDRSVMSFAFAEDNRTIVALAQDVGQRSIFEINTNFGDTRKIYGLGYAGDVQLAGERVYFTRHTLDTPKDVYRINRDGFGLEQITEVNKDKLAELEFGQYEQFSFKGANDDTVYGYWIKPPNFEAGKRYPIAYLVHGGPQGSFGNLFHSRWNFQLWAAAGFGVVMVDFHGSTGYGQAFTDSISRDWGGKPLEDLKKGLQHITQAQPWLDRDRACALGASYGGFMMNWIQGHWSDGFDCLVNHAGLFDVNSFYGTTEEVFFIEHEMGGPVWSNDADYKKFNPADYVENWKTPMLVIHGQKDYRVPYAQGLAAFTTLQRRNIPSKLIIYPEENHWILNKDNLVQWYDEIFKWMRTYTAE